ncbi:hypothetical protein scyTo_0024661, partial [Scyliorhinus torazame]|nr:hypothetical protein [Scyliorhinus torazame]
DPKSDLLGYGWYFVGVLDYDKEKKLYLVQKANSYDLIRDEKNQTVVNGGITETEMDNLATLEIALFDKLNIISK